jgi:putative sterol carrier protein
MSRLREEDWEKPCFHRRGTMPVGDYLAVRLQELAVHSWDIRWGLEPDAEIWEEPLALLVDRVPRWLSNAFRPGLDLPSPVRYRFDVAGPAPVRQDILVNGDSFETEKSGAGQADALFRCDTGNYILLIYGRLQIPQAITDGRLEVAGDMAQAGNFTAWFKGF